MKKLLLALSCALLANFAFAADEVITLKKFEGKNITGIEGSTGFQITVKQGSSTGATVKISKKFEDRLIFELDRNGTLRIGIKTDRNGINISEGDVVTAEVVCQTIERISASSGSNISLEGDYTTKSLSATASAGSQISNSGKITVNGNIIQKSSAGAGCNLRVIKAVNVEISASAASHATFEGEVQSITGSFSAGATITISGKGNRLNITSSAGARANCAGFEAKDVKASATAGASIEVTVSGSLQASAVAGGNISYAGNPISTNFKNTAGGSIWAR